MEALGAFLTRVNMHISSDEQIQRLIERGCDDIAALRAIATACEFDAKGVAKELAMPLGFAIKLVKCLQGPPTVCHSRYAPALALSHTHPRSRHRHRFHSLIPLVQDGSCAHCFAEPATGENFKKCLRCKTSTFCSSACIKAAWPLHKTNCQTPDMTEMSGSVKLEGIISKSAEQQGVGGDELVATIFKIDNYLKDTQGLTHDHVTKLLVCAKSQTNAELVANLFKISRWVTPALLQAVATFCREQGQTFPEAQNPYDNWRSCFEGFLTIVPERGVGTKDKGKNKNKKTR
jgi:hypothetical protein